MLHNNKKNILLKAIKDPASVYTSPIEVTNDQRTTQKEKYKILKSWALDQRRLMTAQSEHMGDDMQLAGPAEMLQEIEAAQRKLLQRN